MKNYGTIKFYVHAKGWGIITATDGQEYYFHCSNLNTKIEKLKPLAQGKKVSFETKFMAKKNELQEQTVAIKIEFI